MDAGKSSGRKKRISTHLFKGMPDVELTDDVKDDDTVVILKLNERLSKEIEERSAAEGPISISLESLDVNLQHNQSFGMLMNSTGCISNPGGPSC